MLQESSGACFIGGTRAKGGSCGGLYAKMKLPDQLFCRAEEGVALHIESTWQGVTRILDIGFVVAHGQCTVHCVPVPSGHLNIQARAELLAIPGKLARIWEAGPWAHEY